MSEQILFDTYSSNSSSTIEPSLEVQDLQYFPQSKNITNSDFDQVVVGSGSNTSNGGGQAVAVAPIVLTAVSAMSTLALIYILTKDLKRSNTSPKNNLAARSTPLPGYGIMGDKVNEVIELFLDALAVYVHNDNKWECQRRMLCEANQRAGEYGVVQGVVMYFLSLGVSLLLQNQRVSDSLEAMKIGRRGGDCAQLYPKCPFSL